MPAAGLELFIYEDKIVIVLTDHGPGIADVALAMKRAIPPPTTSVPWVSAQVWDFPI